MKKIIKSSILTILFLTLLTVVSHAANKNALVNYGDLNPDGSMVITVEFPDDRDVADSAYDGLFTTITNDGWTVNRSEGTMTKTATGVDEHPLYRYYSGGPVDEGVTVKIATPYTMLTGEYFDLRSETAEVTNSTNQDAVAFSGKRVRAVGVGVSEITISDTDDHNNTFTLKQTITVKDPDGGDDEGTTDFTNATYSYNDLFQLAIGNVSQSDNTLYYIIDNNVSTGYSDSAKVLSFSNGNYCADLNDSMGNNVMKAEDTYIHIFERTYDSSYNVHYSKIAEKQLPKPDLSALNKFSSYSNATSLGSQFILDGLPVYLNGTLDGVEPRNIHFKIGQITDSDLLRALKNGDSDGFSKLLAYAKSQTNPIVDKTEAANNFKGYTTSEELVSGENFID